MGVLEGELESRRARLEASRRACVEDRWAFIYRTWLEGKRAGGHI
jgi:hypothetical protein